MPKYPTCVSEDFQLSLFGTKPPKQLLKWVGNKQRYAPIITSYFPPDFKNYFEPFLGSGAIMGALAPEQGIAGDILNPLIEIWKMVQKSPRQLLSSYRERWDRYMRNPEEGYYGVRESFNQSPNPEDLFFLSRSCYGGIVRFTKAGTMSTPIGPHKPVNPDKVGERIYEWADRISGVDFRCQNFSETIGLAAKGDLVYCDPPYVHSQAILYGAQDFLLHDLFVAIQEAKERGAKVALSIDGSKKSGQFLANFDIPEGLFETEVNIDCGRSMLRRFQRRGENLHDELVADRLLLTWRI